MKECKVSFGKAIELFLVNGTADSIITAELSNWNGMAIKIPRIEVADCDRDDIKGPGVYFLFCKGDDDSDSVYIGESETINERLIHFDECCLEAILWHELLHFIIPNHSKRFYEILTYYMSDYKVLVKSIY